MKIVKNDNLVTLRNDAQNQKLKADDQLKEVTQLAEQVEMNEIKEKITQQTIDDETSKIMQMKLQLETQRNKVILETNKRYAKLLQIEEQHDTVQQFMADKTKLLKGKRDMTELM